jgi:hypothetical protein
VAVRKPFFVPAVVYTFDTDEVLPDRESAPLQEKPL